MRGRWRSRTTSARRSTVYRWEERHDILDGAALLVNATNQGMIGQPPLDLHLDKLPKTALVYDIVYNPSETPLIAAARARGHRVIRARHAAAPGAAGLEGLVRNRAEGDDGIAPDDRGDAVGSAPLNRSSRAGIQRVATIASPADRRLRRDDGGLDCATSPRRRFRALAATSAGSLAATLRRASQQPSRCDLGGDGLAATLAATLRRDALRGRLRRHDSNLAVPDHDGLPARRCGSKRIRLALGLILSVVLRRVLLGAQPASPSSPQPASPCALPLPLASLDRRGLRNADLHHRHAGAARMRRQHLTFRRRVDARPSLRRSGR